MQLKHSSSDIEALGFGPVLSPKPAMVHYMSNWCFIVSNHCSITLVIPRKYMIQPALDVVVCAPHFLDMATTNKWSHCSLSIGPEVSPPIVCHCRRLGSPELLDLDSAIVCANRATRDAPARTKMCIIPYPFSTKDPCRFHLPSLRLTFLFFHTQCWVLLARSHPILIRTLVLKS
ncbi:hypothetical protein CPB85DRAFT_418081 [Mucidula mucida]|nr:hypothetical protein CPB85DRAFT_418081 [Mucidula mucida]